jgi:DNA-binding LacI/PurR family transcriptional regulator
MALGAIRAFEENSIRIPEKISLVGFDDIPEAGFFRPPLSTIKQDFAALGRLSVQCLMEQVDPSRPTSPTRTIQPFLIRRESTAFLTGREKNARAKRATVEETRPRATSPAARDRSPPGP